MSQLGSCSVTTLLVLLCFWSFDYVLNRFLTCNCRHHILVIPFHLYTSCCSVPVNIPTGQWSLDTTLQRVSKVITLRLISVEALKCLRYGFTLSILILLQICRQTMCLNQTPACNNKLLTWLAAHWHSQRGSRFISIEPNPGTRITSLWNDTTEYAKKPLYSIPWNCRNWPHNLEKINHMLWYHTHKGAGMCVMNVLMCVHYGWCGTHSLSCLSAQFSSVMLTWNVTSSSISTPKQDPSDCTLYNIYICMNDL